jgi:hypothetical protein
MGVFALYSEFGARFSCANTGFWEKKPHAYYLLREFDLTARNGLRTACQEYCMTIFKTILHSSSRFVFKINVIQVVLSIIQGELTRHLR